MTLGWAIITTGLHADVKIAAALNATPDAELVAVYSRDQGRAEAFAQKHGAKAAYSNLEALLRVLENTCWWKNPWPRLWMTQWPWCAPAGTLGSNWVLATICG